MMLPLKSTMPATATSTQPPESRFRRDDLYFEASGTALGSLGSLGRQRELIISCGSNKARAARQQSARASPADNESVHGG